MKIKKLFSLVSLACCLWPGISAQTLSPNVLPTQGAYLLGGGYSLSSTLGETYTTTIANSGYMLTQGEQQPYISGCDTCSVCDSILGTSALQVTMLGNLQYQFVNTGLLTSNYINWYVDGEKDTVTLGDTLFYAFPNTISIGWHVVCMQTAHIFSLDSTCCNYICCYDQVCDSIYIDSCDIWKSTDTVSYQADSNLWYNVNLTFHGYAGIPAILIWNFGDGSEQQLTTDTVISHSYPDNYSYSIYNGFVNVIWSLGINSSQWSPDSPGVCCCVDTVWFSDTIGPCNDRTFTISQNPQGGGVTEFIINPSAAVNYQNVYWTITDNGSTTYFYGGTSQFATYFETLTGTAVVCANISYYVIYTNGFQDYCTANICDTFEYGYGGDAPDMRLKYYPNPANDQLTVEVTAIANDVGAIEISDYLGQALINKTLGKLNLGKNQLYVNIHNLVPGLYEMKVTVGNQIKTVKVVKE